MVTTFSSLRVNYVQRCLAYRIHFFFSNYVVKMKKKKSYFNFLSSKPTNKQCRMLIQPKEILWGLGSVKCPYKTISIVPYLNSELIKHFTFLREKNKLTLFTTETV